MMMMMAVDQAGPAVATALQWLALAAFAILAVACVAVLARERHDVSGDKPYRNVGRPRR